MADRFDLINFGKSVVTTTGGTTANVNIDANTLFIDGTNNRVGVGTNAPTAALQVAGDIVSSGTIVPASSYLRNRIINGDMRIDQRNAGSSFSSGIGLVTYGVDRFYVFSTGAAVTGQRVNPSLTGFPSALRITGASGVTYTEVGQRIESFNIADLAGSTVTISFWAAASIATSVTVYTNYAAAQDNYSIASVGIGSSAISINNTLTRYSVSFALPTQAANGLILGFVLPSGLTSGSSTFTLTGVQLEVGSVATPFERRQFGQELQLCQRYYSKSYNIDIAPGTGNFAGVTSKSPDNTMTFMNFGTTVFPVLMRASPTITTFNPSTGSTTNPVRNENLSTNHPIVTYNVGQRGFAAYIDNSSIPAGAICSFQWTAAIEL